MPLSPIPMNPAYRYGKATPWGGSQLKTLFFREIPDAATGESLEVSAIPGLNSTDQNGQTLTALIEQYGARMTGEAFTGEFPLLLKLIAAQDQLSVQVHPDDPYAKLHENKLGKTEAWIILDAPKGATLVYGVKEGVTREELLKASNEGASVEKLLRYVPVKAGDAFFIPAGTVHAIGSGITLYEIQQSSDVTYRFYDWERKDQNGNKRELHIKKAIDVTDIDTRLNASVPTALPLEGKGQRELILSCEYFKTERYAGCENAILPLDTRCFSMLTSIEDGELRFADECLLMPKGSTVFLPSDGYKLSFSGKHALLSYPVV